MQWQILNQSLPQTPEDFSRVLLANRKIADPESFFNPQSPLDITLDQVGIDTIQMKQAVDRILLAKNEGQKIVIYGDYDADGICATAVLWQVLHKAGCQVLPFIPHREKHGYGISTAGIEDILAQGELDLLITVDNGIVAHQPLQALKDRGIEVIVTDHHQPDEKKPQALAVVHSTKLCGTTVGWMLARAVVERQSDSELWQVLIDSFDLCGIATIADQVPLRDANRSFAKFGLQSLQMTTRVGLRMLAELAGVDLLEVSTKTVNFVLAPRINAMGRLEHGLEALRLLCTQNLTSAKELAQTLSDTNDQRKELTYDLVEQALIQVQSGPDEVLIIVDSSDYHEGVVGLIAGRLAEKYHKPAIAISVGVDVAKASARSIKGVNIVELIRLVRDDLLDVGGHPMAAGFGLKSDQIGKVKQRLQEIARQQIDPELLQPKLEIDCQIPFQLVTEDLLKEIEKFEPFGKGNSEPVIALDQMIVLAAVTMGRDKQHLKLTVTRHSTDQPINCLWWNHGAMADKLTKEMKISLAGNLELNEWNNRRTVQLKVRDLQQSELNPE